jgi:hypothetical protein
MKLSSNITVFITRNDFGLLVRDGSRGDSKDYEDGKGNL